MSVFQILKALCILPIALLSIIINHDKPFESRYQITHVWAKRLIRFLGYELETIDVDKIPKDEPVFFVANHQGTLDPALLVASNPYGMTFISKAKNERMPIFGRFAKAIEVIHFDHESRQGNVFMLREAVRYLKKGSNVLIFPEGTRSRKDEMNPFKAGAIQPAYLAKATIMPITLNRAYCIDNKKDKSRNLKVTYGDPIRYEDYQQYDYTTFSLMLHDIIRSNIEYQATT